MSLKNDVKVNQYVLTAELSDNTIITLYGELNQTCMKEQIVVQRYLTTPGGRVISEKNPIIFDTFDNQDGIRKEFYMGYSVCHALDHDAYNKDNAIKWAKNHFSRPIVTYNFTYLNKDQIHALMINEIDFIVDKRFPGQTVEKLEFEY